jgi:hypothetical protein
MSESKPRLFRAGMTLRSSSRRLNCAIGSNNPVWSKIKTDLSRGGVMIETQHPTEPDSSVHRATRWN